MFEGLVDPIFAPLLNLPPVWALFIVAFVISIIITFAYKLMTDQVLMKKLKQELKDIQKAVKEAKDDTQKMMAMQKKAMDKNMQYMMHSMKPTLITMIPIIIIFGWLHGHLAYNPISPGEEFSTTMIFDDTTGQATLTAPEEIELISPSTQNIEDGKIIWRLKGSSGEYLLRYEYNGVTYDKDVLITESKAYKAVEKKINSEGVKLIKIDNQKLIALNLFGWKLGWLGTYIIFSIFLSMTLRKMLKVH